MLITESCWLTKDGEQPYSAAGSDGKQRQTATTAVRSRYLGTDQWRYNHVEVSQVHVLGAAKLRRKHINKHLEVLGSFC